MISLYSLYEQRGTFLPAVGRAGKSVVSGAGLMTKGLGYGAYKIGDYVHRKASPKPHINQREAADIPEERYYDDRRR